MILWHGRIWTTDHDNLWKMDEGERPDGWTVHLMNGNGRQTMVVLHRRTEVDSRTKIERPPHGRSRTTDHDYLSLMDGGGRWTKTGRLSHGRIQTMSH